MRHSWLLLGLLAISGNTLEAQDPNFPIPGNIGQKGSYTLVNLTSVPVQVVTSEKVLNFCTKPGVLKQPSVTLAPKGQAGDRRTVFLAIVKQGCYFYSYRHPLEVLTGEGTAKSGDTIEISTFTLPEPLVKPATPPQDACGVGHWKPTDQTTPGTFGPGGDEGRYRYTHNLYKIRDIFTPPRVDTSECYPGWGFIFTFWNLAGPYQVSVCLLPRPRCSWPQKVANVVADGPTSIPKETFENAYQQCTMKDNVIIAQIFLLIQGIFTGSTDTGPLAESMALCMRAMTNNMSVYVDIPTYTMQEPFDYCPGFK